MNFTVDNAIYKVDPENICVENEKVFFDSDDCKIHDKFIDKNDQMVYLVTNTRENKLVWVLEDQIERKAIIEFNNRILPVAKLDCNTYKGKVFYTLNLSFSEFMIFFAISTTVF